MAIVVPDTQIMAAAKGVYLVNDTTPSTKTCKGFLVLEDTVISSIQVDGAAPNVVTDYISTPATPVRAGAFFTTISEHSRFTSLTLASGSIIQVLA